RATQAYFQNNYAGNGGECKGNAFKHVMFRILDAVSFGREFSRKLGDAHESDQDDNIATIMDKKNNAIGLRLYEEHKNWRAGVFYWTDKTGNAMNNGRLVFFID